MKKRRSWVSVVVVATVQLLSAALLGHGRSEPNPNYLDSVVALKEDRRTTVLTGVLRINTDERFRLVAPNKCQRAGEIELERLARISNTEESYVFVPGLCLWLETGSKETSQTVLLDVVFLDALVGQFNFLTLYHLHPDAACSPGVHFPAYRDFLTLTLINGPLINRREKVVRHRVISTGSSMEYSFSNPSRTRDLINRYLSLGLGDFAAQNLAYTYARKEFSEEYEEKVKTCSMISSMSDDLQVTCRRIKTEIFVLDITPILPTSDHSRTQLAR